MPKRNFYVINKSGGLIYSCKSLKDVNLDMVMSSYIHTIYAHVLDLQITPEPDTIVPLVITMKSIVITVYKTFTNYTFLFMHENEVSHATFLKAYKLFVDYALKDPFYILEMPINSEKFDTNLKKLLNSV